MKRRASELEFISQINRDGSGVTSVGQSYLDYVQTEEKVYKLHRLSISEDTYIAINFNAYVVKIKK